MKITNIVLIICLGFLLIGCNPVDPSVFDLKSPCVSNKYNNNDGSAVVIGQDPCIKYTPELNSHYLK